MARMVRISTLNPVNATIDPKITMTEAVKKIKDHLNDKINQVLPDRPDLIILPECCDMPLNYTNEKLKEFYLERGSQIFDFLADISRYNNCYIAYPAIRIMHDRTWRNSIQLIGRDGSLAGTYNKNHPVICEIEEDGILCGNDISIIDCDFGRVGLVICFDLNFDQLRLKYAKAKPDLIVFSSQYHGGIMQQYWAYSCRSHFVGSIAGGLPSAIISPVGQIISSTTSYFNFTSATVNLDCAVVHLDKQWDKLTAMRKKYGPKVKVTDPGLLGSVLISSETEDFDVKNMIEEFNFELLDDYFERSLSYHKCPDFIEK